MREFLQVVPTWPVYWWVLVFFAFYPVVSAIVWVSTAFLFFYLRREREEKHPAKPPALENYPMVSVLIPAFCEEKVIAETLECATRIDYPHY